MPSAGTIAATELERSLRLADAIEVKNAMRMSRQVAVNASVQNLELGTRHIDGLGTLRGVIDANHYYRMIELDPNYWSYDSNREKYYRDHPEADIKKITGGSKSKYIGCSIKEMDNPKFHVGKSNG